MEDCLWYELLTKLIMFRSVLHIHFPFLARESSFTAAASYLIYKHDGGEEESE